MLEFWLFKLFAGKFEGPDMNPWLLFDPKGLSGRASLDFCLLYPKDFKPVFHPHGLLNTNISHWKHVSNTGLYLPSNKEIGCTVHIMNHDQFPVISDYEIKLFLSYYFQAHPSPLLNIAELNKL